MDFRRLPCCLSCFCNIILCCYLRYLIAFDPAYLIMYIVARGKFFYFRLSRLIIPKVKILFNLFQAHMTFPMSSFYFQTYFLLSYFFFQYKSALIFVMDCSSHTLKQFKMLLSNVFNFHSSNFQFNLYLQFVELYSWFYIMWVEDSK